MFNNFINEWLDKPVSDKDRQIIRFMLENAFERLSPTQKRCIEIKYGEKVSKQEYIARRLKISHQAVSKQLSKAEKYLFNEVKSAVSLCEFLQNFATEAVEKGI